MEYLLFSFVVTLIGTILLVRQVNKQAFLDVNTKLKDYHLLVESRQQEIIRLKARQASTADRSKAAEKKRQEHVNNSLQHITDDLILNTLECQDTLGTKHLEAWIRKNGRTLARLFLILSHSLEDIDKQKFRKLAHLALKGSKAN